jgi:hypothetical protein
VETYIQGPSDERWRSKCRCNVRTRASVALGCTAERFAIARADCPVAIAAETTLTISLACDPTAIHPKKCPDSAWIKHLIAICSRSMVVKSSSVKIEPLQQSASTGRPAIFASSSFQPILAIGGSVWRNCENHRLSKRIGLPRMFSTRLAGSQKADLHAASRLIIIL